MQKRLQWAIETFLHQIAVMRREAEALRKAKGGPR